MTNNRYHLDWVPDIDVASKRGSAEALLHALEKDIRSGRLKAGQKLPPQRQLAWTLGLNPATVNKAYRMAVKRGLISGEVGRGSFVRAPTPHAGNSFWPNENPNERRIDFCDNFPPPQKDTLAFRKGIASLGQSPLLSSLLQYQQDSRWAGHVPFAQCWLARCGMGQVEDKELLITNGALHAGFVCLLALCKPGDVLVTEELTSQAIKGAAARLGLRICGVHMDAEGVDPDHLKEILAREKVSAVYLVPTLHNPTTITLDAVRRRRIAEVLSYHGVPLIEDDIFAPLATTSASSDITPISSMLPELGFYIAGFSKALAPALRLAFLRIPAKFYPNGLAALRVTSWMASPLLVELASELHMSGDLDKIISAHQGEIAQRQACARRVLGEWETLLSSATDSPHVWLEVPEPWRASQFQDALAEREVMVLGSDAFAVSRSQTVHAVRICLGTPPDIHRVEEGCTIMRDMISRGA